MYACHERHVMIISYHIHIHHQGLLDRNPTTRLGSKSDADEIKSHPFFAEIDWQLLYERKIKPPFQPVVSVITDTGNFDTEFTNMPLDSMEQSGRDEDVVCLFVCVICMCHV